VILARIDQSSVVRFPVISAGALVTGLASGDFAVSVVAPDGTVLSPAPAVTESPRAGVYQFTVSAAFWIAHGAGSYIYTVVMSAPAPVGVFSDWVQVLDEAGYVRLSVTFDAIANTIRANASLATDLGQKTTGLSNATLQLFDRTGASLTTLATTASPDAQGTFAFNIAAPAFLVGETETYFVVTVAEAGPPARVWRSIVGATFSRTS